MIVSDVLASNNSQNRYWTRLVEWSPFPLFPPYGKLVGKMSKQKDLKIYETRVKDGNIEIKINCSIQLHVPLSLLTLVVNHRELPKKSVNTP